MRARGLYNKFFLFKAADRRATRFCRSMKMSEDQCTKFTGYLVEEHDKPQTILSVCNKFNVCGMNKKAAPKKSSCAICSTLQKNVQGPLKMVYSQLDEMKAQVTRSCLNAQDPPTKQKCKKMLSKIQMLDNASPIRLTEGLCEKFLCNNFAKAAYTFLPKSSGSCLLCHKVLNITLDVLRNSMTLVRTILVDVEALCKSKACHASVKESEKIVSYVFSKLEVSDVCEGVGVCPGSQEDQAMFNVMKNAFIANGDELESCSVCDKVDKADSSMSTVKVFMKQACLEVDDDQLKRKCAIATPIMNADTTSLLNKRKCREMFCNKARNNMLKKAASMLPKSEKGCAICKTVMKIVGDGIQGMNQLTYSILKDVDSICDSLKNRTAAKACHYSVNETRKIYDYVVSKLNFGGICVEFGVCSKKMVLQTQVMFGKMETTESSKSCPVCDNVLSTLNVGSAVFGTGVARVASELTAACVNESGAGAIRCQQLASQLQNFSIGASYNRGLCSKLFCNSILNKFVGLLPKTSATCSICQSSMKIVEDAMKQSTVLVDTILADVAAICEGLKSKVAIQKCQKGIAEGKSIFDYVMKKLDFSGICKDLGLCPKENGAAAIPIKAGSTACPTCDRVEKTLHNGETQLRLGLKNLKQQIDGACEQTGSSIMTKKCSSLAPRIESLQTLTLSLPNGAICKNYLCSSSKNMRSSKSACSTCQEVVKIVSMSFVDAGKLVDDILADVDSICSSLKTEAAQQKCHFAVKETKLVFNEILKILEPGTFCKDLGFCSASKRFSKFFGFGKNMGRSMIGAFQGLFKAFSGKFQG